MDNKKLIELVKKLREETGMGVMEVKRALEETNGDETKAKEILKARGYEKMADKAEREIKAGRVTSYVHTTGRIGVMLELLCETDFVANHEDFISTSKEICLHIAAMNPKSTEELMESDFVKDPSKKVSDLVASLVAKFGENIKIGQFVRYEV